MNLGSPEHEAAAVIRHKKTLRQFIDLLIPRRIIYGEKCFETGVVMFCA
jgi:hypothetical protein